MLEGAFLHFKGIGNKKFEYLREMGILEWKHILENATSPIHKKFPTLLEEVEVYQKAKEDADIQFLVNSFHNRDKWRILYTYFSKASFFDIETDGYNNRITTIACFHKGEIHQFVKYKNLDQFLDLLDDVELMVSFNGTSFDVPVLLRNFHITEFPAPHIDLRWIFYHEGFKGGLKKIEQDLGIQRPKDLEGVDGMEAINLWYRWNEWKDKEALEKLVKYCSADVISLFVLSEKLFFYKNANYKTTDPSLLWKKI